MKPRTLLLDRRYETAEDAVRDYAAAARVNVNVDGALSRSVMWMQQNGTLVQESGKWRLTRKPPKRRRNRSPA